MTGAALATARTPGEDTVLVVVSDDASTATLARASLSATTDAAVNAVSLADALNRGVTHDGRVIMLDVGTGEALADDRLMRWRRAHAGVPLIVVSRELPAERIRALVQLNPADWLYQPLTPQTLTASVAALLADSGGRPSEVVAFVSANGGAGATTLAIAAASHLAKRADDVGAVFLADLDFAAGGCGLYLDNERLFDLRERVRDPARLDLELLDLMTAEHEAGFHFLSLRDADPRIADLRPELVGQLLDLITVRARQLVIDMPTYPTAWSHEVLMAADVVVVVCERNVPSLKRAHRIEQTLTDAGRDPARIRVVVNKSRGGVLGGKLGRREIAELFEAERVVQVPERRELFDEALNRGVPIHAVAPRAAPIRALGRLVDDVFAPATDR